MFALVRFFVDPFRVSYQSNDLPLPSGIVAFCRGIVYGSHADGDIDTIITYMLTQISAGCFTHAAKIGMVPNHKIAVADFAVNIRDAAIQQNEYLFFQFGTSVRAKDNAGNNEYFVPYGMWSSGASGPIIIWSNEDRPPFFWSLLVAWDDYVAVHNTYGWFASPYATTNNCVNMTTQAFNATGAPGAVSIDESIAIYPHILRQTDWTTLGVVNTEVPSQIYILAGMKPNIFWGPQSGGNVVSYDEERWYSQALFPTMLSIIGNVGTPTKDKGGRSDGRNSNRSRNSRNRRGPKRSSKRKRSRRRK
jgi:hypothetical protein